MSAVPRSTKVLVIDPVQSAVLAGLRYVRDTSTGLTRKRAGNGWSFVSLEGKAIRDPEILTRIRSLVIPPAWTKVWICPTATGHLQAVGYDARGRKQYRYHAAYSQVRNHTKFGRLTAFAKQLPMVRKKIEKDLAKPGLPREKVLATVAKLLEATYIRIGNEIYAKQNKSFGLTTMQTRHVDIEGSTVKFHFRGKSGQDHEIELEDRRLARVIQNCHDLPGSELFQYVDAAGTRHTINSEDVNGYIRSIAGEEFSAKDFRTWGGTYLAAQKLVEIGPAKNETEAKKNIVQVIKDVAATLGNRPATCRKYYIHPVILTAYNDGRLFHCVKAGEQPDEECVLGLVIKLAA